MKGMGRKRFFLVSLVVMALGAVLLVNAATSGGPLQLNQRLLIQGIGVDKTEEGVLVSVHVSDPLQQGAIQLYQAEGSTVLTALDQLSQTSGKVPLYSHNMMVILGRECAEDGAEKYMDFFVRYYETRPSVSVFMAEEEARDILETQQDGEYPDTETLVQLAQSGSINGWVVNTRVIDFVNQLAGEGSSPYMPVLGTEENQIRVTGTALFRQDVLCGILSPEESRILLLITKRLTGGQVLAEEDETGKITLSIQKATACVSTALEKERPVLQIGIQCELEISSMDMMRFSGDGAQMIDDLEKQLSQKLTEQTGQVLNRTLGELHSDPFGFGRLLMQTQTGWWKEKGKNWESEMANCQFSVEADVSINRVEAEVPPLH